MWRVMPLRLCAHSSLKEGILPGEKQHVLYEDKKSSCILLNSGFSTSWEADDLHRLFNDGVNVRR